MRTLARFLSRGLILLAILVPVQALAQTGAASLTGIVTDQSGAVVPGATVTATNQATNVEYTAISNDAGNYNVTSLPVGAYVVKAELSRFKTASTKPIQMEAKQVVRLDFKLELGGLAETVEVTSETQVLQTESTTVGQVISGTTLNNLPLNGRNTGQLSLLLPGAVTPNPSTFTAIRNFGGGRPYVNGNREQTNNYTIDGVDMNESIDNLVAYQPSPDALAQISVETNNYAADTGNVAGAVISNVLKSGSNQFHGNAFEYYRNSSMDANSWSNNRSGAAKPKRRQDIYGGTLRRAAHEEQAVLLRQLPGHAERCARVRDRIGRACLLAERRSLASDQRPQGSSHGRGVRRQPDSDRPDPSGRRRDSEQSDALSPAQSDGAGPDHRQLRGRDAHDDPRQAGGRPRGLEPVEQRQDLRALLDRRIRVPERQAGVSAASWKPHDGAIPQPGAQLEPDHQAVAGQRSAVRLQPDHDRQRHAGLGGHR